MFCATAKKAPRHRRPAIKLRGGGYRPAAGQIKKIVDFLTSSIKLFRLFFISLKVPADFFSL